MAIQLLIATVDKSDLLQTSSGLSFEFRNFERGTASARLVDPAGAYRPVVGESFDVWQSGTKLWGGQIDSVKEQRFETAAGATFVDLQAVGWAYILDRRFLRGNTAGGSPGFENGVTYLNKTPRQIVADIITTYLAGEIITLHADVGADGTTTYATTLVTDTFTYGTTPVFPLQDGQSVTVSGAGATVYYVVEGDTISFKLALTVGGTAVDFTAICSGSQTVSTIIDIAVFDHVRVSDAISQLASLCGYIWWVDKDAALHFVPSGITAAAFDLDDTSANFRNMSVTSGRTDYRNRELRRIGYGNAPWGVSAVTGDGSTVSWEIGLTDTVRAAYAWQLANVTAITVNGTEKTIGVYRAETGKDFYWRFGDTRVYQDPGATPLSSSDLLSVTYFVVGQDVQQAQIDSEITARSVIEGGTGIYENLSENTSSVDVIGAVNDARGVLAVYGATQQSVSYETDTAGLVVGAIQNINVSAFAVNADFVINTIRAGVVDGQFFRYQVEAIATAKKSNAVDFFKSLAGSSSGGGSVSGGGGAIISGGSGMSGIATVATVAGHVTPVLGSDFTHEATLTGNVTLDAPTSLTAGKCFCVRLIQDATGGRTVTFAAFYKGLSEFDIDTRAGRYAALFFQVSNDSLSATLLHALNGILV